MNIMGVNAQEVEDKNSSSIGSDVMKQIKEIDINNMTPLQALDQLNKLIKLVKS